MTIWQGLTGSNLGQPHHDGDTEVLPPEDSLHHWGDWLHWEDHDREAAEVEDCVGRGEVIVCLKVYGHSQGLCSGAREEGSRSHSTTGPTLQYQALRSSEGREDRLPV